MESSFSFVPLMLLSLLFAMNATALTIIKWNKHVGEFEPILELPFYDVNRKNDFSKKPQESNHNFHGQPLRLTYYQNSKFVEFHSNDTKISGIYGDVWNVMSEMLNFTLVVERIETNSLGRSYDNGSYSGIFEKVRRNQTDIIPKIEGVVQQNDVIGFTEYFWNNHYKLFAQGPWKPNRTWMFEQFSPGVWWLVLNFVVILGVGRLAMERILTICRGSTVRTSILDHIFDTLAALCSQGKTIDYNSTGLKILTITISIFSWLILVAYSARLVYSTSSQVIEAPYSDLNTLYKYTNLRVIVKNGSFADLLFSLSAPGSIRNRIVKSNRLTVVSTINKLNELMCSSSSNHVVLDGEDDLMAIDNKICDIFPTGSETLSLPVTCGIGTRVENKRSIDIGMMKLNEFGLLQAIRRRWLQLKRKQSNVREADDVAMGLDQFVLVLRVLLVGVVASIIICIAENIVFALKKRKRNLCSPRRPAVIEQPLRNPATSTIERPGRLYYRELYPTPRPGISWRPLIRSHWVNFKPAVSKNAEEHARPRRTLATKY